MVLVYGLPLDSFTFDVIFWPCTSSVHAAGWFFFIDANVFRQDE
jgi:hypothetical protein